MKKQIFSIMGTRKKKAIAITVCMLLAVTVGAGFAFATSRNGSYQDFYSDDNNPVYWQLEVAGLNTESDYPTPWLYKKVGHVVMEAESFGISNESVSLFRRLGIGLERKINSDGEFMSNNVDLIKHPNVERVQISPDDLDDLFYAFTELMDKGYGVGNILGCVLSALDESEIFDCFVTRLVELRTHLHCEEEIRQILRDSVADSNEELWTTGWLNTLERVGRLEEFIELRTEINPQADAIEICETTFSDLAFWFYEDILSSGWLNTLKTLGFFEEFIAFRAEVNPHAKPITISVDAAVN